MHSQPEGRKAAPPFADELGRAAGEVDDGGGLAAAGTALDDQVHILLEALADLAARQGVAIVSGTTRLGEAAVKKLDGAAKKVPVSAAVLLALVT